MQTFSIQLMAMTNENGGQHFAMRLAHSLRGVWQASHVNCRVSHIETGDSSVDSVRVSIPVETLSPPFRESKLNP